MKRIHFILILLIALCAGCETKGDQKDLDIIVYKEVFKQLTDSIVQFPEYPPPPPPDLSLHDEYVKSNTKEQRKYKELISKINLNQFVVSISDSTHISIDSSFILNKFRDSALDVYSEALINFKLNPKKDILFNIDSIRKIGKYEFVKFSELQKMKNRSQPIYPFSYFGNLTLSRIYFNKNFSNGFFTVEISLGIGGHFSFLILISKELKWKIKKCLLLSIE